MQFIYTASLFLFCVFYLITVLLWKQDVALLSSLCNRIKAFITNFHPWVCWVREENVDTPEAFYNSLAETGIEVDKDSGQLLVFPALLWNKDD